MNMMNTIKPATDKEMSNFIRFGIFNGSYLEKLKGAIRSYKSRKAKKKGFWL